MIPTTNKVMPLNKVIETMMEAQPISVAGYSNFSKINAIAASNPKLLKTNPKTVANRNGTNEKLKNTCDHKRNNLMKV